MILNRLGNKRRLTSKILPYIPEHDLFIEPFFGAGGFYFHKPKAKYNVVNDSDAEVYNLFQVVRFQAEELAQVFQELPIHQRLWDHWRKNKEEDEVWRAARFLFLSNFGYMGKAQTLRFPSKKTKELILQRMILTAMKLENVDFMCCDFRQIFRKISISNAQRTFCYCDPPYLDTANNYASGFTEQDSTDLFDCLQSSGVPWMMSEFDHPFILQQARDRDLNVHILGERRALNSRKTEILVSNFHFSQNAQ